MLHLMHLNHLSFLEALESVGLVIESGHIDFAKSSGTNNADKLKILEGKAGVLNSSTSCTRIRAFHLCVVNIINLSIVE